MIKEIGDYLVLLEDMGPPIRARIIKLAVALDRLACAYHIVPAGNPADDAETPRTDYGVLRSKAHSAFPDFGYYAFATPMEVLVDGTSVGDALDDIVDIAAELQQIMWRRQHLGESDAAWYFKFSYEHHWGRHLQNLRSYIHAMLFEHPDHAAV